MEYGRLCACAKPASLFYHAQSVRISGQPAGFRAFSVGFCPSVCKQRGIFIFKTGCVLMVIIPGSRCNQKGKGVNEKDSVVV